MLSRQSTNLEFNPVALFTAGAGFATHFATIFQPIAGEFDLIGKNPDSERTIKCMTKYQAMMEELRSLISPELELIQNKILGPTKELQGIVKLIRKTITKRDHKVLFLHKLGLLG